MSYSTGPADEGLRPAEGVEPDPVTEEPAARPAADVGGGGPAADVGGGATSVPPADVGGRGGQNMLPERKHRRLGAERFLVRLIATAGIVGIGVAIAAVMVSSKSQGWIVGLVVAIVTVVLSAVLWSSRQL